MTDARRARLRGPDASARRASAVVAALREQGRSRHTEPYTHTVPFTHRSGERIEPLISLQWFMRMDELAAPAIEVVRDGRVRIHPESQSAPLRRVAARTSGRGASPASCGGATRSPSGTAARRPTSAPSRPRATAGSATPTCSTPGSARRCGRSRRSAGPRTRRELRAFYPTDVLSTARDILFLWVARMVMMGLRVRRRHPVHRRLRALGHPGARRAADEQVAGHGHRPARRDRRATAPTPCASACSRCPRRRTCATPPRRSSRASALANKLFNASRFVLLNVRRRRDAAPRPHDRRGPLDPLAPAGGQGRASTAASTRFDFAKAALGLYDFVYGELCDWYLELVKGREFDDDLSAHDAARAARDAGARPPGDPVRDRGAVVARARRRRGCSPPRRVAPRRRRRCATRPPRREIARGHRGGAGAALVARRRPASARAGCCRARLDGLDGVAPRSSRGWPAWTSRPTAPPTATVPVAGRQRRDPRRRARRPRGRGAQARRPSASACAARSRAPRASSPTRASSPRRRPRSCRPSARSSSACARELEAL